MSSTEHEDSRRGGSVLSEGLGQDDVEALLAGVAELRGMVYTQADIDAAVAAERERCARLCEGLAVFVHPMARQGNPHSMQYMGAQITEGEHHMALACAKSIRGA